MHMLMVPGLMTSACLPVIRRSSPDSVLSGVVCIDITLGDLYSDVTDFTQGELSYAFVVDGQKRLLSHPMMPRPYKKTDDPVFIKMSTLESKALDIQQSMIM